MEISKNKFVVRSFDQKQNILTSTWLKSTATMNEEEFKEEMINLAELVIKHKARFLLSSTKDMLFPIVPELQEWITQNIAPKIMHSGFQKQAIIIPEDIFAQMSLEQTIEDIEKEEHTHKTKFFTTNEEALKWFNN